MVVKNSVEDEMGLWIDDPMNMTLPEVPGKCPDQNRDVLC